MNKGTIKLLLSRLSNDSYVAIKNNGIVSLKLMEDCLKNTKFLIATPNCMVDANIKDQFKLSSNENIHILQPNNQNEEQHCIVDCKRGSVNIQTANFIEMMNIITQK